MQKTLVDRVLSRPTLPFRTGNTINHKHKTVSTKLSEFPKIPHTIHIMGLARKLSGPTWYTYKHIQYMQESQRQLSYYNIIQWADIGAFDPQVL